MGRISALTELTTLASDDYLVVLDSSANIAKKITIANAFGITDLGWVATGESWTYASWSSTTRIGTITVPTDATTKYYAGMRIKITQSTGGTKYGIIHLVASTLLTVFFPTGTTLNNEAITSPQYSIADTPLGFPKSEDKWKIEAIDTSARQGNTPTNNTWYVPSGSTANITIGVGIWRHGFQASNRAHSSAGSTFAASYITSSTTTSTETDAELTVSGGADQPTAGLMTFTVYGMKDKYITISSGTETRTLLAKSNVQSSMAGTNGFNSHAKIYAISAYL